MNDHYRAIAQRLRGPLAPILIPFAEGGEVDHGSLADWVAWMAQQGVPVMWTTGGTSEMASLTEAEIFEATGTIARANGGRAFFIASTGPTWPVSKCAEFCRFAREQGVDAVKVQVNWIGKPTAAGIEQLYGQVAAATDLPLLAYTVGQPGMSVELLTRLIDRHPQLVGIKNDTDDVYRHTAYLQAVPPGFQVITGGMMRPFFLGYQFGQRCYADSFATFAPRVSLEYFAHLESGQTAAAIEQIKRYEMPWSDLTTLGRHGFDAKAANKTILWLTGHFATNHLRFPRTGHARTGPEVGVIREFLKQVGVPVEVDPETRGLAEVG